MPKGSYQGTHATTSAERKSAGSSSRETDPRKRTRSLTPASLAMRRKRCSSGSPSSAGAGGPPATTSSAPGTSASAAMTLPTPLRGTSRPTDRILATSPLRAAVGPAGVKWSRSTPQGTTDTRRRGAPKRSSSNSSSLQVATIWSTSAAMRSSACSRSAGLVSDVPCWRRLTTPRAWKVCSTGSRSSVAASSAAMPDIQKCACTTSGGATSQERRRWSAKRPMYGGSASLGTYAAGPASTCSTTTPWASRTRAARHGASRRVCTTTSWPRAARAVASAAT